MGRPTLANTLYLERKGLSTWNRKRSTLTHPDKQSEKGGVKSEGVNTGDRQDR